MKVKLMMKEQDYMEFNQGARILEKVCNSPYKNMNLFCGIFEMGLECYAFVQSDTGKIYYIMIISNTSSIHYGCISVRDCANWDVFTMGAYANYHHNKIKIVARNQHGAMKPNAEFADKYFNIEEIIKAIDATIRVFDDEISLKNNYAGLNI